MSAHSGQYFRNTDTIGCIGRIKVYQGRVPELAMAVGEIELALAIESNSKKSRRKLCGALESKLIELQQKGLI